MPPEDKLDILRFVQASPWPVKKAVDVLGLARSTFYDWRDRYRRDGYRGLVGLPRSPIIPANRLLESERAQIVATANALPLEGYRKVASFVEREGIYVSKTTVYRVLSKAGLLMRRKPRRSTAGDRYVQEPTRPGELWATDISYIFVEGFGFFYLFSVLDTFSRYVVHWELRPTMTTDDAKEVVQAAVRKAGITPQHGLRLLHDNGSQFVSRQFKRLLRELRIQQVRTAYRHPETNGRLERYHLTLKDATVRLESYRSPQPPVKRLSTLSTTTTRSAPTRPWTTLPRPRRTLATPMSFAVGDSSAVKMLALAGSPRTGAVLRRPPRLGKYFRHRFPGGETPFFRNVSESYDGARVAAKNGAICPNRPGAGHQDYIVPTHVGVNRPR